jgi:toxin-antitoxin system PIN domain toxin
LPASRDLLDVSAWLPLAAPDHVHHRRVRRYWEVERAPEVVFCRVTALAFVRYLMNPLVMHHGVLDAAGAWEHYEEWRRVPGVSLLAEPAGIEECLSTICGAGGFGSRGLTAAYLAAFARTAGCRLVSFDDGFRRFEWLDFLRLEP